VLVSIGFITLLFALSYKVLPEVQLAWREVWIGAAMTSQSMKRNSRQKRRKGEQMARGVMKGKAGLMGLVIVPLVTSCALLRPPPVTVQRHEDGTETKLVRRGLFEREEAAKKRLLASLGCANYEVREVGLGTETSREPSAYWIRYRCEGKQ